VALGDVFDDRQSQAGAAGLARAAAVDPVEALGETGQVLPPDADARVGDRELAATARLQPPPHRHRASVRRVAQGVADQVPDGAVQLGLGAADAGRRAGLHRDDVAALVERAGVAADTLEQPADVDPGVDARPAGALDLRERERVGDQAQHALPLLAHQRVDAGALGGVHLDVAQRLDEAHQHRERAAQLVRHVGDELAPHRLVAFALGDVLRQQQLHPVAVRAQLHRQRAAARHGDHDRLAVLTGAHHRHERRCTHEIGDRLLEVALRVEAEVLGRHAVHPLDAVGRIEQQHAVGRRFDRRQELRDAVLLGRRHRLARLQGAVDAIAELGQRAGVHGRGAGGVGDQPARQRTHAQRVEEQQRDRQRGQTDGRAVDPAVRMVDVSPAEEGARAAAHRQQQRADGEPEGEVHVT